MKQYKSTCITETAKYSTQYQSQPPTTSSPKLLVLKSSPLTNKQR